MTNTTKTTTRPARKQQLVGGRKSPLKAKSRSGIKRIGWSGGLSEQELARPGGILLSMLIHHANENGHQLNTMAAELNVTYGYIHQLRRGTRPVAHISHEFATACARYLGCPRMTVLLAASQVKPDDVFEDPFEMFAALPAALTFIRSSPKFGPLMSPEVFKLSRQLQLLIVTLFEAAEGRTLLPSRRDMAKIAKDVQNYARKQETLGKKVEADRKAKTRPGKKKPVA